MREPLVTFETAKLAKERGFNEGSENLYKLDGVLYENTSRIFNKNHEHLDFIEAPTQFVVHKWLRDNYSLLVVPCINENDEGDWWMTYKIWDAKQGYYYYESFYSTAFDTYEEALEKGLQKALKSLL